MAKKDQTWRWYDLTSKPQTLERSFSFYTIEVISKLTKGLHRPGLPLPLFIIALNFISEVRDPFHISSFNFNNELHLLI